MIRSIIPISRNFFSIQEKFCGSVKNILIENIQIEKSLYDKLQEDLNDYSLILLVFSNFHTLKNKTESLATCYAYHNGKYSDSVITSEFDYMIQYNKEYYIIEPVKVEDIEKVQLKGLPELFVYIPNKNDLMKIKMSN